MALVEPRLLDGFRDLTPAETSLRSRIVRQIGEIFDTFGFEPLRTPHVEHADILLGQYGGDVEGEIYRLADKQHEVALRHDLSVPLARHIAEHRAMLSLPVKRYQIGAIFTVSQPTNGHSRELLAADADIIGTSSRVADAECVHIAWRVLDALEVPGASIGVNNRKVFRGLQNVLGVAEEGRYSQLMRAINRLETLGEEGVRRSLADEVNLSADQIDEVFRRLTLPEGPIDDRLDEAERRLTGDSELARSGFGELRDVFAGAHALGVPESALRFDLFTTRSPDYYTSTVFKTTIASLPGFGSVVSGGRYDDLVSVFLGRVVPVVGLGVRIDRMLAALHALDRHLPEPGSPGTRARVLVGGRDELPGALRLASRLREAGVPTTVTYDPDEAMIHQIRHAQAQHIPFAIRIAPDAPESVALQWMRDGRQVTVPFDEAVQVMQSWHA